MGRQRRTLRPKLETGLPHGHTARVADAPQNAPSSAEEIQLAKAYAMLAPNWFCDKVLQSPNDPWQSDVFDAVADAWKKRIDPSGEILPTVINHRGLDKISIRAMHGCGKTHFAGKLMHWFNFVFKGRIVCTAPKQQQLLTRLWPEFHLIMAKALKEYSLGIQWAKTSITWNGDPSWYAIAETGSQPENLAGHHAEYMLTLVDEASGVSEEMFPQIEAAQSSGTFVPLVLIGNPTRTTGTFWASHCRREVSEQYFTYHIELDKAPRVSRKWVDNQIKKYGINSPVVQVRCFGEFADTEPDQLMALEWIENAKGKALPVGYEKMRFRVRISGDIADGGVDECVFTVARIYDHFTVLMRQYRKSWGPSEAPIKAAQYIHDLWREWAGQPGRGDDIVVDRMGVGAGTAGTLIVNYRLPVVQYAGGEQSDDPEAWRNKRVQSYLVTRNGFRDGWIYIDEKFHNDSQDWEDFLAQMCAVKRKPGTERVEDVETKQELLKRVMKSPDMADSTVMIFATSRPTLGDKPSESILILAPTETMRPLQSAQMDFGNAPTVGEATTIGGNAANLSWD